MHEEEAQRELASSSRGKNAVCAEAAIHEDRGQSSPSADLWLAAGSLSVCSALWTENSEWEQAERKDTNHVSINTERAWTPAASVTGGVQSHFLSLVGPVSTL